MVPELFLGTYRTFFGGLGLEIAFPWRKNQSVVRKDFWLDAFYMYFNFFVFGLVITGIYATIEHVAGLFGVTMTSLSFFNFTALPAWAQILIFFVLNDFCAMVYARSSADMRFSGDSIRCTTQCKKWDLQLICAITGWRMFSTSH